MLKKGLGIFLILFGISGLSLLLAEFTLVNLFMPAFLIFVGYRLFTGKGFGKKKSRSSMTKADFDELMGRNTDPDDEIDEDYQTDYIPPKHKPERGAYVSMYLAGSKYDGRQDNIKTIYEKYGEIDGTDKLEFIPDSENEFDPNAIKVVLDGMDVGFIPKKNLERVRRFFELHPNYFYWWKIKLPDQDDYNQYSVMVKLYD